MSSPPTRQQRSWHFVLNPAPEAVSTGVDWVPVSALRGAAAHLDASSTTGRGWIVARLPGMNQLKYLNRLQGWCQHLLVPR